MQLYLPATKKGSNKQRYLRNYKTKFNKISIINFIKTFSNPKQNKTATATTAAKKKRGPRTQLKNEKGKFHSYTHSQTTANCLNMNECDDETWLEQ